jgi:hypothetical protein
MTKDKYNLFGRKKRVTVPRKAIDPNDPPRLLVRTQKPEHIDETVYHHKISKLEPPEDPRPEAPTLAVRHQLTGYYLAPKNPLVAYALPETLVSKTPASSTPVKKTATPAKVTYVATSTESFFSAVKPLAAKPLLKIPEQTSKEVVKAPPVPGSREAKLRDFISKHF